MAKAAAGRMYGGALCVLPAAVPAAELWLDLNEHRAQAPYDGAN